MACAARALSYLIAFAVTAVGTFVAIIVFAGPHSGLLPDWLEGVVLVLGWAVVLTVPVEVARGVWRRVSADGSGQSGTAS